MLTPMTGCGCSKPGRPTLESGCQAAMRRSVQYLRHQAAANARRDSSVEYSIIKKRARLPLHWSPSYFEAHAALDHKMRIFRSLLEPVGFGATQGHTFHCTPPMRESSAIVAWHSTPVENVDNILRVGIKSMAREFVHLLQSPTVHGAGKLAVAKLAYSHHANIEVDLTVLRRLGLPVNETLNGYIMTPFVDPRAIVSVKHCFCPLQSRCPSDCPNVEPGAPVEMAYNPGYYVSMRVSGMFTIVHQVVIAQAANWVRINDGLGDTDAERDAEWYGEVPMDCGEEDTCACSNVHLTRPLTL
jgi:RNA:NAD 2'-phosphotransferase (TPT1/KptA family)